jgi:hypothetical protein
LDSDSLRGDNFLDDALKVFEEDLLLSDMVRSSLGVFNLDVRLFLSLLPSGEEAAF